jgi:hypothetical protein
METNTKSTAKYWVLFFLSVGLFAFLIWYKGGLSSLALPFVCTYFAKAMDIM